MRQLRPIVIVSCAALLFSCQRKPAAVSATPSAVSVTPASGSGAGGAFRFSFSHPDGAEKISWIEGNFSTELTAAHSCHIVYRVSDNRFALLTDAGNDADGPGEPGSQRVLENSQCTVNMAASSVTRNGADLVVTAEVKFKPEFQGEKKIYMFAQDLAGAPSNWQVRGSWTVAAR